MDKATIPLVPIVSQYVRVIDSLYRVRVVTLECGHIRVLATEWYLREAYECYECYKLMKGACNVTG